MELITIKDDANEIVRKLNKREYREELTKEEEEILKKKNMFVIFGASDDLLEVRGLIDDEIGAYRDGIISLDLYKNRFLPNKNNYLEDLQYRGCYIDKDIVYYYFDNNTIDIKYNFSNNGWELELIIDNPRFKNKIKYKKAEIVEGKERYGEILIVEITEIGLLAR